MLNVRVLGVFVTVLGDETLSGFQVVAEERVKHFIGLLRVGGGDGDQTARFGVHGSLPHHVGLIFAKTFGALEGVFLALKLFENFFLLGLVIGKIYVVTASDLKEGRFRNKRLFLS